MRSKRPPREELQRLIDAGASAKIISELYRVDTKTAHVWLNRYNLRAKKEIASYDRPWSRLQDEWLKELVHDRRVFKNGKPSPELIAEQMTRRPEQILQRIKELGLEVSA